MRLSTRRITRSTIERGRFRRGRTPSSLAQGRRAASASASADRTRIGLRRVVVDWRRGGLRSIAWGDWWTGGPFGELMGFDPLCFAGVLLVHVDLPLHVPASSTISKRIELIRNGRAGRVSCAQLRPPLVYFLVEPVAKRYAAFSLDPSERVCKVCNNKSRKSKVQAKLESPRRRRDDLPPSPFPLASSVKVSSDSRSVRRCKDWTTTRIW